MPARLTIYQPRQFLSARAGFFAVKLDSGRSTFLKVSLQTDEERPLKQMFASEKKRGERLVNELWLRKTSS